MSTLSPAARAALQIVTDIVRGGAWFPADPIRTGRQLAVRVGPRSQSPRKPTAPDATHFTLEGAIARATAHSTRVEFEVLAAVRGVLGTRPDAWANHLAPTQADEVLAALARV